MLDWSKIFNIAFAAGAGALVLFFFVSTVVVAGKGKRKCNAFDVILRILSSLVFIASTVMFACAVLTMLKGDVCIAVADGAATLVFFDKSVQLPLVDLFILLSDTIGLGLAVALFLCSLAALIVDCSVANKKSEKKSKAKAVKASKKSPEQLKREAELERIRRIGESAVKKTDAAASHAAKVDADNAVAAESQADWRETPDKSEAQSAQTGFVGITENNASDFDTFDDLDDAQESTEQMQDVENTENGDEFDGVDKTELDEAYADATESTMDETEPESSDVDGYSEPVDDDTAVDDDIRASERAEYADGDELADGESDDAERVWNEPADDKYEGGADEYKNAADGYEQATESEQADDREMAENTRERYERDRERDDDDDVEPDRGIYIPEIRTITKAGDEASEKPAPRTRAANGDGKKPTQKKASGASAKRAAAESAAASAKQPSRGGKSRARKSDKADVPAEKKLPVTRRYVILDRRNAVNMFGDYLRERSSAEKEKLQSSINTIIIE